MPSLFPTMTHQRTDPPGGSKEKCAHPPVGALDAVCELDHEAAFSLVSEDWRRWLENFRGHGPSIGLREVPAATGLTA